MVMAGASHKEPSGTLPLLKKEERPTVRFSNQPPSTFKFLNTNILCVIGLLCCVCCAYSIYDEVEVNITVHIPIHLLKFRPEVFVRKQADVRTINNIKSHALLVDVYDLDDARLPNPTDLCRTNTHCDQSCDPINGQCICKRGYKLVGESKCEDVNECHTLDRPCHKHAHCRNTEGTHTCQCIIGYYGDGHQCHDCNDDCPPGTYEVQPCNNAPNSAKKCAKCSDSCKEGYYMTGQCQPRNDTFCKVCKPMCGNLDYESAPCAGSQNRQCKEMSSLSDPTTSANIFLEDLRDMVLVVSYQMQENKNDNMVPNVMPLTRKSGLQVRLTIKELNLAPIYRNVDHSQSKRQGDLDNQASLH
ncbi:hypothetical protein HELRODRAFT_192080 [Helobdella robusta]|uniref:EGF-like domain-containing protein n=1 Tax=Helobdella robusta TaxID=6412 RepID=T1FTK2_HELRO|nr:hypothetical protein HELRODRAFT_192080 [Helobdella robusta]ESO03018.1 hypothetical protein HELRODRAFT_192080 [Helobdella robusta]